MNRPTATATLEPFVFHPAKHELLLCEHCGSWDQLQATAWVDANTHQVTSLEGPNELLWCDHCEREAGALHSLEAPPVFQKRLLLQLDRLAPLYQERPHGAHALGHLILAWASSSP